MKLKNQNQNQNKAQSLNQNRNLHSTLTQNQKINKLAKLIEEIVINESESLNRDKLKFKVIGFQLKSKENVTMNNWSSENCISYNYGRYSKNSFLKNSPYLLKWNQIK